ncbi:MAG: hypothetical protein ABSB96_02925 [Gaiellaceae bacterium]
MPHGTRLGLGLLLVALGLGSGAGSRASSAQADSVSENTGEAVVAVTASKTHSCALLQNGSIKCWGGNSYGQLGDGTTTNRLTPVDVKGVQQAITVSAGNGYTCALLRSHRMLCWGSDRFGELGDGKRSDSPLPVAVDGIENVRAMSTEGGYGDENSTCAVLGSGMIKCWGASAEGALGDLSLPNIERGYSLSPVTVAGVTNAVAISDGNSTERCAVLGTGKIECWGSAFEGEECPDCTEEDLKPALVEGIPEATAVVNNVRIDYETTYCALIYDGTVSCWWAEELEGRIKGISDAISIASAGHETCALVSGGKVACWDAFSDTSNPEEVKGLEDAISIDGGGGEESIWPSTGSNESHFCAVVSDGGVECWGDDYSGELGDGVSAHRSYPVPVTGIDNATSIGAGMSHTCASLAGLQVACWGGNRLGQLGDGKGGHEFSTRAEASPIPVTTLQIENASAVAVGWWHACALLTSGGVLCWGAGLRGQLGFGRYLWEYGEGSWGWIMSRFPRPAKGLKSAVAVGAGGNASCALLSSGEVECWGGWVAPAPTAIEGVAGATAISIAQGGVYMCAIVAGGQVECWNYESPEPTEAELESDSYGHGELASPPSTIAGISGASAVDATSACAVVRGMVQCWSPDKSRATAFVTGIDNAVQLSGYCALLSDARVACWQKDALEARRLERITDAVAFSAGEDHECVLVKSGAIECWGDNYSGELGNGELPFSDVPVRVIGLS